MSLTELLSAAEQETIQEQSLVGPPIAFRDYLDIVKQRPAVASLSHARLYDMIVRAGITTAEDGSKYHFFDDELYGLDGVFHTLVQEYFAPAARRLDIRKRILLLVGPVGCGKSSIATLLKKGLEQYSREHELYCIDGCPMFEEPLHLIHESQRPSFRKELGVAIEGELCPVCRWKMLNEWQGRIGDVPVKRFLFSEKDRIGVGSYRPSDPKAMDIAELTGHVNLAALVDPRFAGETDPRVYRFDGELNVASRGMLEMIEMLKLQPQFLYELNTLAGEQRIKVPQFALIYADELILSHTNSYEHDKYFSDPANEAMVDRIFVVKVPYNLRVSDEIRIYRKLIDQASVDCSNNESASIGNLHQIHIAPNTLKVASMLAVLSRLVQSENKNLSAMVKLKLYDGEQRVGDYEQKHLREITQEAEGKNEGMDGLSPRFIINRLSSALARGERCINPLDALRSLRDGIKAMTAGNPKEQEHLFGLVDEVRKDYDETVKKTVQRAFVHSYEDAAKTILAKYLDNVNAFCNKTKVKDTVTDEDVEPDERLMQSIEDQLGITGDSRRREFREGIMRSVAAVAMKGHPFVLSSRSDLQEAVEKKLFSDMKDMVRVTTSVATPDKEQSKKINEVVASLTDGSLADEERYCEVCARELLKYVGQLLR